MIEAAGVVIVSAEDGVADTIKPRLMAAGGDPSKVLFLAEVPDGEGYERPLSLPEDVPIIERAVLRVEAKLVILDPLMAFIGPRLDPNKDRDVRRALAPLKVMAEKTGAAVVIIRHLVKAAEKKALYRGGASIGIIGVARSGLLLANHPEDENRRVLAPLKSNLGKFAPSLVFELTEAENGAVRVEWGEETRLGADALLAVSASPKRRSALDVAKDFVQAVLKDESVPSTRLEEEALSTGISPATLRRAKEALGVTSNKDGKGPWLSALPDVPDGVEEDREHDHKE